MHPVDTSAAATDVPEFVTDLDGGQFEHRLSIALSTVAAAVVDHEKKGSVSITFSFERIPGTHQVRCEHSLKYSRPTMDGKLGEEEARSTVLHVQKFGKLSLAQPGLPGIGKQAEIPG